MLHEILSKILFYSMMLNVTPPFEPMIHLPSQLRILRTHARTHVRTCASVFRKHT